MKILLLAVLFCCGCKATTTIGADYTVPQTGKEAVTCKVQVALTSE